MRFLSSTALRSRGTNPEVDDTDYSFWLTRTPSQEPKRRYKNEKDNCPGDDLLFNILTPQPTPFIPRPSPRLHRLSIRFSLSVNLYTYVSKHLLNWRQ